jgi:50S ribosomal protein L16 3-hydroxylase
MLPGLAALIHPHPLPRFVESVRRDEAFAIHGVEASRAEFRASGRLSSLDALLGAWPDPVDVHLPGVADEAASVSASPRDAAKMFAAGMGLLFDEAQRHSPELVPWLDAIRIELGFSALTHQRCLLYASPAGKGTAPHFDQNVNVVVQLEGTKTWWLAPNAHVERPMTRHTMGLAVDAELQSYARLPMPEHMPEDRVEIVLQQGSILFVPRGMWHATRAETDALSLNFTFSPPTWIDLLTAALRGRLALSSEWRQTATAEGAAELEALLGELAVDARSWSAADILAVTEGGADPGSD